MRAAYVAMLLLLSVPAFAASIPALAPCVNDLSGVLSGREAYLLNSTCQEIYGNSSIEIALLLLPSTSPYSIEDFAQEVFNANGIGSSGRNNGILIVVATGDRKWRIQTGAGLQDGPLPDDEVAAIAEKRLVPALQQGKYAAGLKDTMLALGEGARGKAPEMEMTPSNLMCLAGILIAFFAAIYFFISKIPEKTFKGDGKEHPDWDDDAPRRPVKWPKRKLSRFGGGKTKDGGAGGAY